MVKQLKSAAMLQLLRRKDTAGLFAGHYIDGRALYLYQFGTLPCIAYINDIDLVKANEFVNGSIRHELQDTLQFSGYNYEAGETQFSLSYLVLSRRRIIELGQGYVALHYHVSDTYWAQLLLQELSAFRVTEEASAHSRIGFVTGNSMN
jgi:hypothetical protein